MIKISALYLTVLMAVFGNKYQAVAQQITKNTAQSDALTLNSIYPEKRADIISLSLEKAAAEAYNLSSLPNEKKQWIIHKNHLKEQIIQSAKVVVNHALPLKYAETGSVKNKGYTIKKIYFQTRQDVYATANLYIPEGAGPFPAVINTHGHWPGGKTGEMVQACAVGLALNGFVCLNIDAFGAGERTTIHGENEYHGANLGASLLDIGESLLGNQISDNIRGVDLLCSLSYVDKNRIGATGASGGGNQTMWLSAIDERIKACMPVVSVGTFQSYIMASNCVCELLPNGLTITEESGVLALIAPRALKICSALKDSNKSFFPSEMIRSFENAQSVFSLFNAKEKISYQLFDTPHGYWPEIREAMVGWFNKELNNKGDGAPVKENSFTPLPEDSLMVFAKGARDPKVVSIIAYCIAQGKKLAEKQEKDPKIRAQKLNEILFGEDKVQKVLERKINLKQTAFILKTKHGEQIPLIYYASNLKTAPFVLLLFAEKTETSAKQEIIKNYLAKNYQILCAELWGIGSNASPNAQKMDGSLPAFHTLSRAEWWLGNSVMNRWTTNIKTLISYIEGTYMPVSIVLDADREVAVAAMLYAASGKNKNLSYKLRNSPLSYRLSNGTKPDFFNMAIHIPGFLVWADISTLLQMSGRAAFNFISPRTMEGERVDENYLRKYKKEITQVNKEITINFLFQ